MNILWRHRAVDAIFRLPPATRKEGELLECSLGDPQSNTGGSRGTGLKSEAKRLRKLDVHPVTPERWQDMTTLFGPRGACGGCWCMYWRLTRSQFEQRKGTPNKRAMKRIIDSGRIPGLLGYIDGQPVAWCSVAPRGDFPVLGRSRTLRPIDEQPVWSVTCFVIARPYRNRGLGAKMLEAAKKYAASQGATILEGYPFDYGDSRMPDAFVWSGLLTMFEKAGFKEVSRRSRTRPIVRCNLRRQRSSGRARS